MSAHINITYHASHIIPAQTTIPGIPCLEFQCNIQIWEYSKGHLKHIFYGFYVESFNAVGEQGTQWSSVLLVSEFNVVSLLFPPKETFRLFIHHRIPWKSSLKNCHCPKLFTKPQTKGKRSTNKVNFLFYERCLSLSACVCLWVCEGQNVGSAQIKACQRALRSKAFMEHKSDPPPNCFLLLSWRGLTHPVFPLSEPNEKHGGN